jgi:hypothetical protein
MQYGLFSRGYTRFYIREYTPYSVSFGFCYSRGSPWRGANCTPGRSVKQPESLVSTGPRPPEFWPRNVLNCAGASLIERCWMVLARVMSMSSGAPSLVGGGATTTGAAGSGIAIQEA